MFHGKDGSVTLFSTTQRNYHPVVAIAKYLKLE